MLDLLSFIHFYARVDLCLYTLQQEHPDLSKTEKKELCRVLDCQKLSPEVRGHAVRNEHLPLRTVVQVLFFEQEKGHSTTDREKQISRDQLNRDDLRDRKLAADGQSIQDTGNRSNSGPGASGVKENLRKSDDKLQLRTEPSFKIREVTGQKVEKGREIREEGASGTQLNSREKAQVRRIFEKTRSQGRGI